MERSAFHPKLKAIVRTAEYLQIGGIVGATATDAENMIQLQKMPAAADFSREWVSINTSCMCAQQLFS